MRVPEYQLGEWCEVCEAPRWLDAAGEHRCEDVWRDYLEAIINDLPHPLRAGGFVHIERPARAAVGKTERDKI